MNKAWHHQNLYLGRTTYNPSKLQENPFHQNVWVQPCCYGCLKTILSFATMFGAYTVFVTGRMCTVTNFDYNKPHGHKYVQRLDILSQLAAGFWLCSLANLTLTQAQCHGRYYIKMSLVVSWLMAAAVLPQVPPPNFKLLLHCHKCSTLRCWCSHLQLIM